MTKNETIMVSILLVILVVVTTIYAIHLRNSRVNKIDYEGEYNYVVNNDYFNDDESISNEANNINNNEILTTQNTTSKTNTIIKNEQTNSENVVGQEEQEGSIAKSNEETAIELAKKEWGISVDSYTYEPTLNSDGTYTVKVISNSTGYTAAKYTVNIQTGAVME